MDKGQYWIFNILVEAGCVFGLIDPERIDWYFSPGHGLDRGQLSDVLAQLFERGDLMAEKDIPESRPDIFLPTRSEIETLLQIGAPDVGIFLTPQGGRHWENLSVPDWDRCISTEWGDADWWGAISADRLVVERYLASPGVQARVVPDTEVWDVLAPWQATYWKTLPIGYRVRFHLAETEEANPWAAPDADWYSNFLIG